MGDDVLQMMPSLPGRDWPVLGMVAVFLVALLLVSFLRRLRDELPTQGIVPATVATLHVVLQVFALLTAAGVVGRLLPPALEPAVPWALVAVAVAIGWSSRDVLPDLVAAAVITFERRLRPGTWMSLGELEGLVERRGLRAVWVRDAHGNRVAIPNRRMLSSEVAMQEVHGPVYEVKIRVESGRPPREVRRALVEAAITSPWVRSNDKPTARQDGEDPRVWHVRAQLLEMRFASRFEGDLLERAEDVLATGS
jgi:small-conductance mechanosensitive channel